MKRLILLFALLSLLAAPALADDEAISDLLLFSTEFTDADGAPLPNADCTAGGYLRSLVIVFTPPVKTPDSYLLRWTARKDRTWRDLDKPNAARAGNLAVRHTDATAVAESVIIGNIGPVSGKGRSLKVPAGRTIRLQIRPFYGDRKGPRARATINSPDWIARHYGDQAVVCA